MDTTLEGVVGFLGLALTIVGIWLTVRYGRQIGASLELILKRLGPESSDNR
jgi:hypothetical protein